MKYVIWIRRRKSPTIWTAERTHGHAKRAVELCSAACLQKGVLSGVVLPEGMTPEGPPPVEEPPPETPGT